MNGALDRPRHEAHASRMRALPARIAACLLSLLFVSIGVVHVTHVHPADEVTVLHPVCTICQFHAPVAAVGNVHAHVDGPEPGAQFVAQPPESSPAGAYGRTNPSRAPPVLLAS